uniref:Immunoglobulin domain-containing protein n=1 Tax=Scophthalmus maximus TaxID=52904 RepID=A0A8D3B538_SCOMX
MMKSFLLLIILSLITGCEAREEDRCQGGWVEFTCKYPKEKEKYQTIKVVSPSKVSIESSRQNEWVDDGKLSLYHNTSDRSVRVVVKSLTRSDLGKYRCKFDQRQTETNLKLKHARCQTPRTESATEKTTHTITCDFSGKLKKREKFLCKEEGSGCVEIQSTGRFTLTTSRRRLDVSVSSVSSQDAGVYWCGLRSEDKNSRTGLGRIQLQVQIPPTASTPSIHQSPVSSTSSVQSTTVSAGRHEATWLPGVIFGVVSAAVSVLVFVLIYRRYKGSKTTINEDAQSEDHGYAEIEECPQKSHSGTGEKTLYVTANFPTNPSAFTHPPDVQSQRGSGDVSGDTSYNVGGHDQRPASSTVNQPSSSSENPPSFSNDSLH